MIVSSVCTAMTLQRSGAWKSDKMEPRTIESTNVQY